MKGKNSDKRKSYIFTRETLGMTVMLFSAIIFVMLFTRGAVFSGIGTAICTFMYGSFGYGSIFITALCAYLGVWLTFEKSVKIKPDLLLSVTACVLVFFMLFHAVSTRGLEISSYGTYLSQCYNNAAAGWSGYSFGGAVCGLIVYPVAKLTTFIGAYVIFSVLLVLMGYVTFLCVRRRVPQKISEPEIATDEYPPVLKEEESAAEASHPEAGDRLYSVTPENEILETRYVAEPQGEPPVQNAAQPEVTQPYDAFVPQPPAEVKEEQKDYGKKILFENGEFAAESYRRNMIFNGESYFSNTVTPEDYLSNFADAQSEPQPQTYSQSYQNEVLNEPEKETPSNYIYGERPVENLDGAFGAPAPAPAPEEPKEEEPAPIREFVQPEEPEEPEEPEAPYIPPEIREPEEPLPARGLFEREERPEPPAREEQPEEEHEEEPPRGDNRPLFGEGRESFGSERREESSRGERSRADIFDDGDDVLGLTPRGQFERGEARDGEERPSRGLGDNFTRPERTAEPVGFTTPLRRTEEKPEEPKEEPKPEKPKHVWKKYVRPTLDLLDDYPENNNVNTAEIEDNKAIITETLRGFKIDCEISNVTIGPAITRYDVIILDKLNIKRSLNYRDAIAIALKKDNVNAYLNYAHGALSIEVPNNKRSIVGLKSMLASPKFINCKPNSLTFGLGKNVEGEVVCPDITKMPHLLVAGTTGSGKSICLSALLISLLYKYGPEDLRLILVDPKQVEFISYDKLPHLMINEILYDVDKTIKALNWANKEMERRYTLFKEMTERGIATKNLDEYNAHLPEDEEKLPKIVIVLDEFGDLMLANKKEIEGRIIKLVQKARACGIHLILATQRPSVDCITGLIKSNLPTRIGFKVNSFADSSTIFDVGGAEKLLGKGDMYFRSTESPDLARIQGCFIDTHEVQKVTDFIKANNETYFDQEVSDFINTVEEPETSSSGGGAASDDGDSKIDDTFIKALKFCITSKQASVSMIQRRFPVGYIKACKIIDWMENMNYITQSEGSKPRRVIITMEEFVNIYGEVDD